MINFWPCSLPELGELSLATFFENFLDLSAATEVAAPTFQIISWSIITDDTRSTYYLDDEELLMGVVTEARLLSLLSLESSIGFTTRGRVKSRSFKTERFRVFKLMGRFAFFDCPLLLVNACH